MEKSKILLSGLIFKCPFDDELDNCSIKDIRKLSIDKKLEFLNKVTINETAAIIAKHKFCLLVRENHCVCAKQYV